VDATAALKAGLPAVLPTDTVYGLCANAADADAVGAMYRLKGRPTTRPTAILFPSVDAIPELDPRSEAIARALLPGSYTLVVPNAARRYAWLTGDRPDTLGLRVPVLPQATAAVVEALGAVAATSANAPGEPEPRRLVDVPEEIRAGCGAVLDGGELRGTPSTIVDVTGSEPRVLREGAVPAAVALDRIRAAE
jgi:L-threonylcarbamoyladenylate synthase